MGQENNNEMVNSRNTEETPKYQTQFGDFVDNCVIKKSNLLTTTEELFTKENLKDTKDFLKA